MRNITIDKIEFNEDWENCGSCVFFEGTIDGHKYENALEWLELEDDKFYITNSDHHMSVNNSLYLTDKDRTEIVLSHDEISFILDKLRHLVKVAQD